MSNSRTLAEKLTDRLIAQGRIAPELRQDAIAFMDSELRRSVKRVVRQLAKRTAELLRTSLVN